MSPDNKILTLAILGGTGKEGTGLALRWGSAGYAIIIGSRSEEKAKAKALELNEQLGVDTVRGMDNYSAALNADIAVLTVVQAAHAEAVTELRGALKGKILVDTTARVDYKAARPPEGKSAGREAQDILGPEVRVVAAFQNVPAHALQNLEHELDSDVLVCADDEGARAEVVRLAEAGGMRAYEAGGLDNAIVVEGITALLMAINKRYKSKTAAIRISGVSR